MRTLFDENDLDSLHPFAALSDESGKVLWIGRSLIKLVPNLKIGVSIWDSLELTQPTWQIENIKISDLVGEMVTLVATSSQEFRLRGHIMRLSAFSDGYFFALHPALNPSQLALIQKLDISDFELGDPIFDFMLLARSLELSNQRLAVANTELKLDVKLSNTLRELAHVLYLQESEDSIYLECLEKLGGSLGWDIGHVVFVSSDRRTLSSSHIWQGADALLLKAFKEYSNRSPQESLNEIPQETYKELKVSWVSDYSPKGGFTRSASLGTAENPCAVWAPVVIDKKLVAVVELFSLKQHIYSDTYLHFFNLLGMQLSRAIEHIRWYHAERGRIAQLAQSAKMAILGQISAGVAHEISNPISVVSLVSSILKQAAKSGSHTKELLDAQAARLDRCVKRVETIVAELKVFSRDSSRDPMRMESLKKILDETVDLCGATFSAQRIKIIRDEVPEDWMVFCRASQLMQVILNLLSNAHDAVSEKEDKWVKVEVSQKVDGFEIAVTDSGMGVPAELRDKIMDPFFTTKAADKGTGLGLSISANIMIDHGGKLFLDGSTERTRFVVRVPKTLPVDTAVNQ